MRIFLFLAIGYLFSKVGMDTKEMLIAFILLYFIFKGMWAVKRKHNPPY